MPENQFFMIRIRIASIYVWVIVMISSLKCEAGVVVSGSSLTASGYKTNNAFWLSVQPL